MERCICQVLNTEDKKTMTINTEWLDTETFRVTVLRENMVPLTGQTTVTKLREKAATDIPREQSLMEIRRELSGKEKEVQFQLRDTRLSWKRKVWRKGFVDLEPINDLVTFADMTLKWLHEQALMKNNNQKKQEEYATFQTNYNELVAKLSTIEAMKKRMEDSLYARFLLILNEKKKRIRDLEEKLKSPNGTGNRSVYDEDTENSDDESNESLDLPNRLTERKRVSSPVTVASTSKIPKVQLKCSPESEDDFVLKLDETQDPFNMEEETDDDLFSQ